MPVSVMSRLIVMESGVNFKLGVLHGDLETKVSGGIINRVCIINEQHLDVTGV